MPENREDIPGLAVIIQESVDELKSAGVKVIILTGRLQRISIDEALATQLGGVDIIISGGSNTLLADNTDRLRNGDTAPGVYPILTTSGADEPVAIVSTDCDYKYVGRLVLDFDEAGVTDTGDADPAPQIVAITEAVRNVVITKDGKIFGSTSVYLEGRRGAVRTEETNLDNLTVDTNLDAARRVDPTVVASLKNGGGIRASIGVTVGVGELPPPGNALVGKAEGEISQLDILADGGDDYPYPNYPDTNRVDLPDVMTEEQSGGQADFVAPGREQDAFAEYLAANFSETPYSNPDVGPESDERIQNLARRADSLALPSRTASAFETQLVAGLNMISLPLMPDEPYTARSFMEKLGATTVIEYNPSVGKFIGFTANSPGGGFPIEGGKGYIVNVTESKVAAFTGRAWQNAPAPRQTSGVWALVLHARLEGLDGISLTVHNQRTGEIDVLEMGRLHAVWADMNRQTVAAVGDSLTIEVRDASGELIRTLHHELDARDIRRAFTELRLTPDDMIPITTALLPNYPNPFNPETLMPYQLAIDTHAAIRIYTPSGKLVRNFELGFRNAGFYVGKSRAAHWDGRNNDGEQVASGTYFYQLITPDSTATRKMVILK